MAVGMAIGRAQVQQIRTAFDTTWSSLAPMGRDPATGGYRRFAWTAVDLDLRAWFSAQAQARRLAVETDRNGNQWAWWGAPADGAVVTGSHLDSVPGGGAFDGPLGVVGAFLALDDLIARGVQPQRPLAIVNFVDEEGARFGIACAGSRLLTGALDPDRARALRDENGGTLAEAMSAAGLDPRWIGRDREAERRIGVFVELHIEQGRHLAVLDRPVGVASSIRPHGRWRFCFKGEGNHAGTTMIADRRDPMLPFADAVLAARRATIDSGVPDAVATFGRVRVDPNGTNAIPVQVDAWLDARADRTGTVEAIVEAISRAGSVAAAAHGVTFDVERESWAPVVDFDVTLRDRLAMVLASEGVGAPVLATGAGHDAGVLAATVPTAMIFARNPTGVSHSPLEHTSEDDCVAGIAALSATLENLLTEALQVVDADHRPDAAETTGSIR